MSLVGRHHLLLLLPLYSNSKQSTAAKIPSPLQTLKASLPTPSTKPLLFSSLLTIAVSVSLGSPFPSLAIPSINSQYPPLPLTTPFSQSKNLQIGLENGKVRPCPSTNPGCVSTNPKSSNFAFPLRIPESFSGSPIQELEKAILKTQKNATIQAVEDTKDGKYIRAEVDGGFGRDVIEFLVKGDVVAYRTMATKVMYIYPFTTSLGDSKGQEERVKKIIDELGWEGFFSPIAWIAELAQLKPSLLRCQSTVDRACYVRNKAFDRKNWHFAFPLIEYEVPIQALLDLFSNPKIIYPLVSTRSFKISGIREIAARPKKGVVAYMYTSG